MDLKLIADFEAGTLPKTEWTHEAHIFTAWNYLKTEPLPQALDRIRTSIQRYNSQYNGRYIETVTVAFMALIHHRMHSLQLWKDWDTFKHACPDLFGKEPVLLKYYTKEFLFSNDAAARFMPPDIAALPSREGIRLALPTDAHAIAEIYAHYVKNSTATFDLEPPSGEQIRTKIEAILKKYPWLVFEKAHGTHPIESTVRGYAYASEFNERAAYQWSASVSVYLHHEHRERGIGRALYTKLFELLRKQGFVNAFGGISLPNPGSVRLHESFGFKQVAHYKNVGFKLGQWHDVGWWQLELQEPPHKPISP